MQSALGKFALVLCIGALLAGGDVRAETLKAPGSRVVIDAPAGFKLADGFTGFIRDDNSSFMIVETPASAFEEIKNALSPTNVEAQGLAGAKPLKLDRTDDYYALEGTAEVAIGSKNLFNGVSMTRFLLLFHDDKSSTMVTANIMTESLKSGDIKRGDVLRALSGASLRDEKAQELPYMLGYTGALKYAGAFAGYSSFYNLAGRQTEKRREAPEPTISVMVLPKTLQQIGDPRAYAEQMYRRRALESEDEIKDSTPVTIDGLKGWAFDLTAKQPFGETKHLEKVVIYSVVLEYDDGIVLLEATAPAAEADKWLPEFRKIAASFSLKRKN